MRFRKLGTAWSLFWGSAALLLIALWVRSYNKPDYLSRQTSPSFLVESHNGQLTYMSGLPSRVVSGLLSGNTRFDPGLSPKPPTWGFGSARIANILIVFLPYWSVVLPTIAIAIVPSLRQLKWRFGLRTLLIVTTLVAVVLGAVVYAARK